MANINPTVNRTVGGAMSTALATWALGNADNGIQVEFPDYADRSIQVEGTFGGATVTIQGSNDGTNWQTLRDPQGVALTVTSAALKQVLETTRYIRAISSGGTGTAVSVTLFARAINPLAWS